MIIDFNKKREEVERKKSVVFSFVLDHYKEIKESGVNIPYFIRAKEWYNANITGLKDLNYYYKKIIERGESC